MAKVTQGLFEFWWYNFAAAIHLCAQLRTQYSRLPAHQIHLVYRLSSIILLNIMKKHFMFICTSIFFSLELLYGAVYFSIFWFVYGSWFCVFFSLFLLSICNDENWILVGCVLMKSVHTHSIERERERRRSWCPYKHQTWKEIHKTHVSIASNRMWR